MVVIQVVIKGEVPAVDMMSGVKGGGFVVIGIGRFGSGDGGNPDRHDGYFPAAVHSGDRGVVRFVSDRAVARTTSGGTVKESSPIILITSVLAKTKPVCSPLLIVTIKVRLAVVADGVALSVTV